VSEYKTLRALVRWKRDSNRLSGSVAVSDGSILRIRAVRRTRVTGLWTWEVLRNSIGSGLSLDIEAAPQAFIHFQTGEGDFEVPLPELLEAKCLDYLSGAVTVELLPPGAGTARILPPRVAAGSRETIVLEYTVGEGGMAAGGGIRLCFSLRSRWKTFGRLAASYVNNNVTAEELEDRDYTSRYASSGVVLTVTGPEGISETSDALPRLTGGSVTVRVNGNALLPGDVIRLEFRDAVVSEETNRAFHMIVFADTDGDGVFREIEKSPRLDICPASARYLHIVAPSAVSPKEEFAARIQVMDKHMNPVDCFAGEVRFLEGAVKGLPQGLVFSKEGHPHAVLRGLRLRKPAPARLVAGGSVVGRSNYILPVDHTMKIYWGELHEHTIVSDGYESPAFTYEYARDVACLDFCAVCDHAHHTTQAGWERSTQATRDFHQPGRFVTFFAYEWGNAHGGDYNIYAKEQIPCLHTGLGTGFPMPFLGEHSVALPSLRHGREGEVPLPGYAGSRLPCWCHRRERCAHLEAGLPQWPLADQAGACGDLRAGAHPRRSFRCDSQTSLLRHDGQAHLRGVQAERLDDGRRCQAGARRASGDLVSNRRRRTAPRSTGDKGRESLTPLALRR